MIRTPDFSTMEQPLQVDGIESNCTVGLFFNTSNAYMASLSFPVQLLYTVLLFTALFLQHYIAVGDIVVTMAFVLLFVAMFLIVLPILPQTRLNIVNISH